MSRTYAHVRPEIVAAREGHLHHNHLNGECVTYKPRENYLSSAHGANGKCKKIVKVERVTCLHIRSNKFRRTTVDVKTGETHVEFLKNCPEGVKFTRVYGFLIEDEHHRRIVTRDETRECACDTIPTHRDKHNSCEYELPFHEEAKHYGGPRYWDSWNDPRVPSDNEVRMSLRDAANSWNSLTPEERDSFDWDSFVR